MEPRRHPLVRELVLALIFKAAALALIYVAWFGPAGRPGVTAERMAAIVLGPAASR